MDTTTRPAIGTTYQTGDTSPVKGEFSCVKCEESGGRHVIRVDQGDKFPECDQCEAAVTWRLINYA